MKRFAIVGVAGLAAMALGAPSAPAGTLQCGDAITQDTVLHQDLTCTPGIDGLVFGGGQIRLDLNGHTISGSGADTAGVVVAALPDPTIVNGKIRGFENGVRINASEGVALRKLDVKDSTEQSLLLNAVDGGDVERSLLRSPGSQENIRVSGDSGGVNVLHNELRGGKINFDQGHDFRAIANQILQPLVGGIAVRDAENTLIRGNLVDDAGIAGGIAVTFEALNTRVVDNVVKGGNSSGIFAGVSSDQVKFTRNVVRGMDGSGIIVGSSSDSVVVRKNSIKRSDLDGISIADDDALIEDNTANRNADNGIDSSSSNGSGNRAKRNGGDDCIPDSLCA